MDGLALQIASGVLIAALIMAGVRLSVACWKSGETGTAALGFIACGLIGGGLILAGLGVVPY